MHFIIALAVGGVVGIIMNVALDSTITGTVAGMLITFAVYIYLNIVAKPEPAPTSNIEAPKAKDTPAEIKLGKYRHFKGELYEVLCLATQTETFEMLVIYRPILEKGAALAKQLIWARPLTMFCEEVEHEGRRVKRFEFVGEKE